MSDALQILGQLAQVGFLAGIFLKLGHIGAVIEFHEKRITELEG